MTPLDNVCCASLPAASLSRLAELRAVSGVQVGLEGDRAWVRWEPADERVLGVLLPVFGVELFECRDGQWYRPGNRLPVDHFPAELAYRPLCYVMAPAAVQPEAGAGIPLQAVKLELVPDDQPRPASALECSPEELARWADTVPTARLAGLEAACRVRNPVSSEKPGFSEPRTIFLRGPRLPLLPASERFWGRAVLVPLGYRVEPPLPESALLELLGIGAEEIAILREGKAEAIPRAAFESLTRSALRRAGAESI
jgi:hypothetical protein